MESLPSNFPHLVMQATTSHQTLSDQAARDSFIKDIDKNFSVIAPAGVGKTTAIVGRILSLIDDNSFLENITSKSINFAVVTYTHKAANEMKLRARHELIKKNAPHHALAALNKIFFGTIHSFCFQLLQNFGHTLGLPSDLQVLTNDDTLWFEFLRHTDYLNSLDNLTAFNNLQRFINIGQIIAIGRTLQPNLASSENPPTPPFPNLSALHDFKPKTKSGQKGIDEGLALAKHWKDSYEKNHNVIGLPIHTKGGQDFANLWAETFLPLWQWLGQASLHVASQVAQAYQQFRIDKGLINYDDMVSLASKLLQIAPTAASISKENFHVILDEAQDTDSDQFDLLIRISQPNPFLTAYNPAPGRFSMVGDPQQSIYSTRADLSTYLKFHSTLTSSASAIPLEFNVTMRCNEAIVNHANQIFPHILTRSSSPPQVDYVHLEARPWATKGSVSKIQIQKPDEENKLKLISEIEKHEASVVASWIQQSGIENFEISDWHELAILSPRKSWLAPLASALESLGIPAQVHSRDDTAGDNPAYALLTALVTIIAEPTNSFEINGVLREIFGHSDHDIATFTTSNLSPEQIHPLNILHPLETQSPISTTLLRLKTLRDTILPLPLAEAITLLVNETHLKEKLAALPDYPQEFLLNHLNELLIQASLAEESDLSINDYAIQLQDNYFNPAQEIPQLPGHVQLYTCHKSKGLEWPVVIIPFLFRPIKYPVSSYPQIIQLPNKQTHIATTPHPAKKSLDDSINKLRKAELQRLLYVTATRAKNKLFYVDDSLLFPKPEGSFASILNFTFKQPNFPNWSALHSTPLQANVHQPTSAHAQTIDDEYVKSSSSSPENPISFPRRITPSSLVKHSPTPSAPHQYDSKEYGNWWHRTMEHLPWNAPLEKINAYLATSISSSPCQNLATSNIDSLINSPLFSQLQTSHVSTEVPVLAPLNNKALEGIIDLIAFNPISSHYTLIDWKTDAIDDPDALRRIYSPQLHAYKDILAQSIDGPISAAIYHTHSATLLEI